jgi:hypothetical protein
MSSFGLKNVSVRYHHKLTILQLAEEIAAARLRAAIAGGQGNASAGDWAV